MITRPIQLQALSSVLATSYLPNIQGRATYSSFQKYDLFEGRIQFTMLREKGPAEKNSKIRGRRNSARGRPATIEEDHQLEERLPARTLRRSGDMKDTVKKEGSVKAKALVVKDAGVGVRFH